MSQMKPLSAHPPTQVRTTLQHPLLLPFSCSSLPTRSPSRCAQPLLPLAYSQSPGPLSDIFKKSLEHAHSSLIPLPLP